MVWIPFHDLSDVWSDLETVILNHFYSIFVISVAHWEMLTENGLINGDLTSGQPYYNKN